MPQDGYNQQQPKVRNVLICSYLEQRHIRQHSLPARTKYENRCILVFTLQLLLGITCVSCINTINQYNARKRCNRYHPNVRNVVICSCLEQLTHLATLTTCKNLQEKMPFSFYFAIRWHHMYFMKKHHQSI